MMKNNSGILPTEYNVIVRPVDVETKTKGGLIIPDEKADRDGFSRTEGTLVAVSPLAFNYDAWPDGTQPPQVGDVVVFSKYQATSITGRDGADYWLMKDKSIAGVIADE
tara:strand:+ start:1253 stop:1579 length:327 start_codon:yes stop_codon:yes gene_type:complete